MEAERKPHCASSSTSKTMSLHLLSLIGTLNHALTLTPLLPLLTSKPSTLHPTWVLLKSTVRGMWLLSRPRNAVVHFFRLARALEVQSQPNWNPPHLAAPRYLPLGYFVLLSMGLHLLTHLLAFFFLCLTCYPDPSARHSPTQHLINPRISSLARSDFPSEIFSSCRFVFPSFCTPPSSPLPSLHTPRTHSGVALKLVSLPNSIEAAFSPDVSSSSSTRRHAFSCPSFSFTKPLPALDEHCFTPLLISFRFLLPRCCLLIALIWFDSCFARNFDFDPPPSPTP